MTSSVNRRAVSLCGERAGDDQRGQGRAWIIGGYGSQAEGWVESDSSQFLANTSDDAGGVVFVERSSSQRELDGIVPIPGDDVDVSVGDMTHEVSRGIEDTRPIRPEASFHRQCYSSHRFKDSRCGGWIGREQALRVCLRNYERMAPNGRIAVQEGDRALVLGETVGVPFATHDLAKCTRVHTRFTVGGGYKDRTSSPTRMTPPATMSALRPPRCCKASTTGSPVSDWRCEHGSQRRRPAQTTSPTANRSPTS